MIAERRVNAADEAALSAAFVAYFGLTRSEGAILAALHRAPGALCTAKLAEIADRKPGAIRDAICCIRRALEPEGIDTTSSACGVAYVLTEAGRAECAEAIEEMERALREAA